MLQILVAVLEVIIINTKCGPDKWAQTLRGFKPRWGGKTLLSLLFEERSNLLVSPPVRGRRSPPTRQKKTSLGSKLAERSKSGPKVIRGMGSSDSKRDQNVLLASPPVRGRSFPPRPAKDTTRIYIYI